MHYQTLFALTSAVILNKCGLAESHSSILKKTLRKRSLPSDVQQSGQLFSIKERGSPTGSKQKPDDRIVFQYLKRLISQFYKSKSVNEKRLSALSMQQGKIELQNAIKSLKRQRKFFPFSEDERDRMKDQLREMKFALKIYSFCQKTMRRMNDLTIYEGISSVVEPAKLKLQEKIKNLGNDSKNIRKLSLARHKLGVLHMFADLANEPIDEDSHQVLSHIMQKSIVEVERQRAAPPFFQMLTTFSTGLLVFFMYRYIISRLPFNKSVSKIVEGESDVEETNTMDIREEKVKFEKKSQLNEQKEVASEQKEVVPEKKKKKKGRSNKAKARQMLIEREALRLRRESEHALRLQEEMYKQVEEEQKQITIQDIKTDETIVCKRKAKKAKSRRRRRTNKGSKSPLLTTQEDPKSPHPISQSEPHAQDSPRNSYSPQLLPQSYESPEFSSKSPEQKFSHSPALSLSIDSAASSPASYSISPIPSPYYNYPQLNVNVSPQANQYVSPHSARHLSFSFPDPPSPQMISNFQLQQQQTYIICALQQQLEFYFSEGNLKNDSFLRNKMDKQGFVEILVVAQFNRMKRLLPYHPVIQFFEQNAAFILQAVYSSPFLSASTDGLRIGRKLQTKEEKL